MSCTYQLSYLVVTIYNIQEQKQLQAEFNYLKRYGCADFQLYSFQIYWSVYQKKRKFTVHLFFSLKEMAVLIEFPIFTRNYRHWKWIQNRFLFCNKPVYLRIVYRYCWNVWTKAVITTPYNTRSQSVQSNSGAPLLSKTFASLSQIWANLALLFMC